MLETKFDNKILEKQFQKKIWKKILAKNFEKRIKKKIHKKILEKNLQKIFFPFFMLKTWTKKLLFNETGLFPFTR